MPSEPRFILVVEDEPGTALLQRKRLERAGWLESQWEDGDPAELGRPRRRLYQVTPLGARRARAAVRDLQPAIGRVAWA